MYVIYIWDREIHTYQLQADNTGEKPLFFETKEEVRVYGDKMCQERPHRYLFYVIETAEKAKEDGHY